MIDILRVGAFVTWVEEPHLEGPIMPSTLLGPQFGQIIALKKNTKLQVSFVCVKNTKSKTFHWIEAEGACELLSPAASAAA